MKPTVGLAVVCALLIANPSRGADPDRVEGKGGCPTILHTPVVSVVRGTPAVIPANITCENGELTEVLLQVRVTDAGKPTPMKMAGDGNGLYKATVPLSMIQGLTRFWYYIDVRGKKRGDDTTVQTRWYPVNIIEHGEMSDGGGTAGAGGAEEGGALAGKKGLLWLAGGAAVVAGGFAWEDHVNDTGSGGGPPPPPTNAPPQEKKEEKKKDDDNNNTPPPCITTGNEQVSLDNTSPCGEFDIQVFICGNCTNATFRATTTWGVDVSVAAQPAIACPPQSAVLSFARPESFPTGPGAHTINVYANGALIGSFPWPSEDEYFDCL